METEFTKDEQAAYLFAKACIALHVGATIGWLSDRIIRLFI